MHETFNDFLTEKKCTCKEPEFDDIYMDMKTKEMKTHCGVCGGIP